MEWPPPLHVLVTCLEEWETLENGAFDTKYSTLVAQLRQAFNVREHHTDNPDDVLRWAMLQYYDYRGRQPQP